MISNQHINDLLSKWLGQQALEVSKIPQSGSSRQYFRVITDNQSYILCYGNDVIENNSFVNITNWFNQKNCNAPQVLFFDKQHFYLQEDLSDQSLYSIVKSYEVIDDNTINLYEQTLDELIKWQSQSYKKFDWQLCQPIPNFNRQAYQWDCNYFKYYFAKATNVTFNEPKLEADFQALIDFILEADDNFFVIRDFQSRNIIFKETQPYFIDFQGGRKGAAQYDLASLLFQASVNLSMQAREQLLDYYIKKASIQFKIAPNFKDLFYGFVWTRQLQVLGAYGFRGLFQGKSYFTKSIPLAINNVKWLIENNALPIELPELKNFFSHIINSKWHKRFDFNLPDNKLTVSINSFSYKKEGIPRDLTDNGGGFVFDCRALPNPHRVETIRPFNGTQKPIIEFFEQKEEVANFLNNIFGIIEPAIENYLTRNFTHLQINFGCTGGKHRSVYCAQQTFEKLSKKYPIRLKLNHIEQGIESEL